MPLPLVVCLVHFGGRIRAKLPPFCEVVFYCYQLVAHCKSIVYILINYQIHICIKEHLVSIPLRVQFGGALRAI